MNQADVVAAVQASWSKDTSETPDKWSVTNPAEGHCDVSSFVAWEYLGGDLVLGQVHIGSEFQEYHYWNRIDGADLDLTRCQFKDGEVIAETTVVKAEFLSANQDTMKPEVADRIVAFRRLVAHNLASMT